MPIEVKTDFRALDRAAAEALEDSVDEYARAAYDLFDDERFAWPGTTKRQSGELAGTTRDVVDMGTLQMSQEIEKHHALEYAVVWPVDHAAAVFVGAVYTSRNYSMPARNVPRIALQEFNFEEAFAKAFRGKL